MVQLPIADRSDPLAELRRAIDLHRDRPIGELLVERELGAYRGYAEVLSGIERLVGQGARLSVLGRSVCGECLFALSVGPEGAEPEWRSSAVLSGLHPMGWIGLEAHLELLDRLIARPPGARSVISIPLANPDGWLRTEQHLRRGQRRYVRHNARGVDLHRNFDVGWGRRGVSERLVPWLFRPGRHPASEPEVSAMAHRLSRCRIDRALSLHSLGRRVLYPSGRGLLAAADEPEHLAWACRIADALGGHPAARALPRSRLLPGLAAGGTELDWFHERHGALSLVVQCPTGAVRPSLERLRHPFAWFNPERPRESATRVADAVLGFVRGDELPPAAGHERA